MAKTKDPTRQESEAKTRKDAEKDAKIGRKEPQAPLEGPEANFIEFALPDSSKSSSGQARNDNKERATAQNSVEGMPKKGSASSRIPDSVHERFIQIGNNFFFPDGAKAFTDHGNRLTTQSENTVVIQSMVAIARERAAGELTVKGSEFFRKEAWFAAKLAGLEVKGYEPTQLEQGRLVRAIARRQEIGREASADESTPAKRTGKRSERAGPSEDPAADIDFSSPEEQFTFGHLVDHGPARFDRNEKNPMNYYVRIKTEKGDIERWGVDLERAFRQSLSRPGIGDEVGIRITGREEVTVPAVKRDKQGREIGREERHTHRNQWIIERKDFLEHRQEMADAFRNPHITVGEAAQKYPELQGSALQFRMGSALAEQQYKDARQREQFVSHLREYLAKMIESGKPLEPVPLRDRGEKPERPERVNDRDQVPTR